ncbi:MAG: hypothetical protein KAR79_01225 [Simkaniaceae bacterium]|nr:hypothetical protein [Simkaniaceae bacterium]
MQPSNQHFTNNWEGARAYGEYLENLRDYKKPLITYGHQAPVETDVKQKLIAGISQRSIHIFRASFNIPDLIHQVKETSPKNLNFSASFEKVISLMDAFYQSEPYPTTPRYLWFIQELGELTPAVAILEITPPSSESDDEGPAPALAARVPEAEGSGFSSGEDIGLEEIRTDAETALRDLRFDEAIELFTTLGNAEKVKETRIAAGNHFFSHSPIIPRTIFKGAHVDYSQPLRFLEPLMVHALESGDFSEIKASREGTENWTEQLIHTYSRLGQPQKGVAFAMQIASHFEARMKEPAGNLFTREERLVHTNAHTAHILYAIKFYELACSIKPDDGEIHFRKGLLQEYFSEKVDAFQSKAFESYKGAYRCDPNNHYYANRVRLWNQITGVGTGDNASYPLPAFPNGLD